MRLYRWHDRQVLFEDARRDIATEDTEDSEIFSLPFYGRFFLPAKRHKKGMKNF